MPDLLLWCDTETSGLLPAGLTGTDWPTVYEFAWTITGPEGDQRTPLHQVFSYLPTDSRTGTPVYGIPTVLAPDEGGGHYWDTLGIPDGFVDDMHTTSGLWAELADTHQNRPDALITSWDVLARLVLDDLIAAGWRDLGGRSIQLAGDGVAHFEHLFLPKLMPDVFGYRFHYRPHDVSQILNGLATATGGKTPGSAGRLIEAHLSDLGDDGDPYWAAIEIGQRYAASDVGTGGSLDDEHTRARGYWVRDQWARATKIPHRAAADVARTLMGHRLLPRLVGV